MNRIQNLFSAIICCLAFVTCTNVLYSQTSLIHYWSFNSLTAAYHNPGIPALKADYSVIDTNKALVAYTLLPGTSTNYAGYIDNNAGDTTNSRLGYVAGQSLRFRNPSDSSMLLIYMPSTGFSNIVVKYGLESSSASSGQHTQLFDYSIDSGATWKTSGLSITSLDVTQAQFQGSLWGLVTISLAGDTATNNNRKLILRIKFSGSTTGSSGNNRFDNMTVEGTPNRSLMHYWSFNSLTVAYHNPGVPALKADFSVIDTNKALVAYTLLPGTSTNYAGYIDNNAGDTTNSRLGFPAGQSLRFRNPSDSSMLLIYMPSTGYSNLLVKYELESSSASSGQHTQLFDYSIDSGATWKTSGLSITSLDVTQAQFQGALWGLVTISLAGDTATNNNRKLILRIKFSGSTTGSSGNNRFDNFSVEGVGAPAVGPPPAITVSVPATGNVLVSATHETVAFTASSSVSPTRLVDFSADSMRTWTSIATLTASATTYDWIVPSVATTTGFIRVRDTTNNVFGLSGQFTISVPPVPAGPLTLIHYWNFNSLAVAYHIPGVPALAPDYTVITDSPVPDMYYTLLPGTSNAYLGYIDNVAGDTTNSRQSAGAGEALRFRNPCDSAYLVVAIPTTNFKSIIVKYEVESSSVTSGQKTQLFDYSVDGGVTWKTTGLNVTSVDITQSQFQGTSWGLISLNFGSDTTVNNNPKLQLRIKFSGNTTGTSGNNRFDNFSVEGNYYVALPPSITMISPRVGDVDTTGKHVTISYKVAGTVGTDRIIEYSTDRGLTWQFITRQQNLTSYDWIVPIIPTSATAIVRVSDGDYNFGGVGFFTIFYPGSGQITIKSPVSTDTLIVGSSKAINFTTTGVVSDTRKLQFSNDSGKTWSTLATLFQTSTYNWTIPSIISANCFVRVVDTANVTGVSARFAIAKPKTIVKTEVIDYWNFDNIVADTVSPAHPKISDLLADYSVLDRTKAKIEYYLLPGTSLTSSIRFIDPVAPGADTNTLPVAPPGAINNALRLRNPLDSMELRCAIPTTGHSNIILKYALESSSTASGDSINAFDYSIDGGVTWKNGKSNGMRVNGVNKDTLSTVPAIYQGTSWGLVTVDLSADSAVGNNPNFIFRIKFKGNASLAKGNNRLDNFSVQGDVAGGGSGSGSLSVIHYWNFDNIVADTISVKTPTISDLVADYSAINKANAKIQYYLLPGTSLTASLRFIDPVAPGADTNIRPVVAPGAINNALRLRNPVDSMELRCHIPTTGYTGIVVKYALESSSTASGDSTDLFDYSIDGGATWKNGKANGMKVNGINRDTISSVPAIYQGASWGLITVDLSADKTVENNANLILRIRFEGNASLAKGNNRIDNFSVEGVSTSSTGPAPAITILTPVIHDTLVSGLHTSISYFAQGAISTKRFVEFSSDNGKTWSSVTTITSGATTYDWTVPNTATSDGLVRVRDTANVIGVSGAFVIVSPGTVTKVNVGTSLMLDVGDTAMVTWVTNGYLGNTMNLDVSYDGGATWVSVKANYSYEKTNNYSWIVPDSVRNSVVMRATFASGSVGKSDLFDIIAKTTASVFESPASSLVEVVPNPFAQSTNIQYTLSTNAPVSLIVYDRLGKEVANIQTDIQAPGVHQLSFDGSRLASGAYFYTLIVGNTRYSGALTIIR